MRVLIIDDDPFVLKMLSFQLRAIPRDGGLDIETCDRSTEALARLDREHGDFDLVLCDLQMPDVDGVEVVRHLARIGYSGGLVFISGEERRILDAAERLARSHGLRILGALPKASAPARLEAILAQTTPERLPEHPVDAPYRAVDVARAITRRELIVHYQPKVEITTGHLVGVEALVRWQHPVDGLVMPYRFVPVAEQAGLMTGLTRAVLMAAYGQCASWAAEGLELQVAVNVTMSDLRALDFPDLMEQCARDAGVPIHRISLEVTEGQLMTEPRSQLDVLTRLRLKRVSLSIDDFGMGYSSMAQLRDLPFDELKVDRGFVHGACHEGALKAILDASLGLARQLGMRSVGEGVETLADWECLRDADCRYAQGYFIGRPMPPERIAGWAEEWSARCAEFIPDATDLA